MRPWYLDFNPTGAPPVGLGAVSSNPAYSQVIGQLQALANANPNPTSSGVFSSSTAFIGTDELPGQVAYTIDVIAQTVPQFSGGDPAAMAANSNYQTLLAQEQAVIALGDYNSTTQVSSKNNYSSKGNYNVATVVAAANALIPFVNGLTGAGTSAGFNPTPNTPANGTFTPVAIPTKILTSRGNTVPVTTVLASGSQVVGGPVAFAPVQVGPAAAGATGGAAATAAPPTGTPLPTVATVTSPTTGGTATVTTDPSTGATTTTQTNPDGSVTTTTDNGPGGEPVSTTTPAPYFYFFHPRDDSGKLVLALGIGAIAIGLLDLFVNSEPGEKVLDAVAAPVDDVAKAVGIPDLPSVMPDLPEFGPALNPLSRRKIKRARGHSKASRKATARWMKSRGFTTKQIKRSLASENYGDPGTGPYYMVQIEKRPGVFSGYDADVFFNKDAAARWARKLERRTGQRTRVIQTLRTGATHLTESPRRRRRAA